MIRPPRPSGIARGRSIRALLVGVGLFTSSCSERPAERREADEPRLQGAIGVGGGAPTSPSISLDEAFTSLASDDRETREQGVAALVNARMSRELGLRMIAAAKLEYLSDESALRSINSRLLRALWDDPHADFVAAIEDAYDSFAGKLEAPQAALRVLTELATDRALTALIRLLRRDTSRELTFHWVFVPLQGVPDSGLALYPGIFDVLAQVENRFEIWHVVLNYVERAKLRLDDYPAFVRFCMRRADDQLTESRNALDRYWRPLDLLASPGDQEQVPAAASRASSRRVDHAVLRP